MISFLDFFKVFQVNQCGYFVAVVFGFYLLVSPRQCFFSDFSFNLSVSCLVTEPTFDCSAVAVLFFLSFLGRDCCLFPLTLLLCCFRIPCFVWHFSLCFFSPWCHWCTAESSEFSLSPNSDSTAKMDLGLRDNPSGNLLLHRATSRFFGLHIFLVCWS